MFLNKTKEIFKILFTPCIYKNFVVVLYAALRGVKIIGVYILFWWYISWINLQKPNREQRNYVCNTIISRHTK